MFREKGQQTKEPPLTSEPQHSMASTNTKIKTKTLIIGSSILKGISLKGLNTDISVSTNRGAGIKQIAQKLNSINI